jgi:protocatechuate 3,4-dioxygenase beta subunit
MKEKTKSSRRGFIFAGVAAAIPFFKSKALGDSCKPTETNAEGPFHRKGAPWTARLCGADEPGESLVISGRVIDAETCKPLKGATVDVWQANAAGRYDNDDPKNQPDPDKFHLRGQMKTDKDGRYRFETIVPANYGGGGIGMRAKHIHYIVSCPGYAPLTTQCYFEGDKYNETDRLVRRSLIISLQEKKKHKEGTFDIVLAKAK